MDKKQCQHCSKPIYGRSDKRFCDHHCRSSYHNAIRRDLQASKLPITNMLTRNHRILHKNLTLGRKTLSKSELLRAGFDFSVHTHVGHDENSVKTIFCFNLGYLPLENNYFALVNDPVYASSQ